MIPKTINYCWFGGNPLPEIAEKCINSWKKCCPDYEIKEWNEENFNVYQNRYCREAFEAKKWAFVSDYARLKIILDHGGVYFDTDNELKKSISPLISEGIGFIGFQNEFQVTTGLGFAACKNNRCVREMLSYYEKRGFWEENREYGLIPCPIKNTVALKKLGLRTGIEYSKLIQDLDGIRVFPKEYFDPMNYNTRKIEITDNTYSINHYADSWNEPQVIQRRKLKKLVPYFILNLRTQIKSRRDIERYERDQL